MSFDFFSDIRNSSKVYRVIFNQISGDTIKNKPNTDLQSLYNNLVEAVSKEDGDSSLIEEIEGMKLSITNLYKKPENISQTLFIFIGSLDDDGIRDDLNKISSNKNYADLSNGVVGLDYFFKYNVQKEWNISDDYDHIHFIECLINPEDSINYLYLFISSILTKYTINLGSGYDPIICDSKSILVHSDGIADADHKFTTIIHKILYDYKINTYKFSITSLEKTLLSYNIPINIIEYVFKINKNNISNIYDILKNDLIDFFIKLHLSFKPLLHNIYDKNKYKGINTYVPSYFLNNSFPDLSSKKYSTRYTDSKKIFKNISDSNTLYFYTLNNFLTTIPPGDYDKNYKSFLKSFFPQITDSYKIQITKQAEDNYLSNIISIADNLSHHIYINEWFYKYTRNNSENTLKVNYSNSLIVSLVHKLSLPQDFDLRHIFNDFNLSFDVPFSKYRDVQGEDIIYKIYKPITKRDGINYLPLVEKATLYDWIKYKNYEIDNYKVKNIRGFPKEVFFKLKLMDFYIRDHILNNGKVVKINTVEQERCFDILYNDIIYKNINSQNVLNEKIKLGDIVNFYNKKVLYADIEIFKKGIITVNIDTSIFKSTKYTDELFMSNIINRINFFIDKIYTNNRILQSYKYLQMPVKKMNLNIGYVNYPKFKFNFKIEVVNNIDYSYQLLTKIFKNLYPIVYIQTEILQKNDIIEYYDEDLSKELKNNIWVKGKINTVSKDNSYTLELQDKKYPSYKAPTTVTDVSNILIRKEGLDRTYIKLLFKKIPDFEETKPIKNVIIKSLELGLELDDIIDKISSRFSKTIEEAKTEVLQYSQISEGRLIENLTGITTPVITIDYMNMVSNISNKYIANILVENVTDYSTANLIMKFIEFSFDIYNLMSPSSEFKNPDLSKLSIESFGNSTESIKEVGTILTDDHPQSGSEDDGNDSFFDSDNDDYDYSDSDKDDDVGVDENTLDKNLVIESITIIKSNLNQNFILEKLYETDPALFDWKSKNQIYSRTCQGFKRYPKVFSTDEKNKIDARDAAYFKRNGLDINLSSYSTKKTDKTNCDNITISKTNMSNCSAIKYGSDTNKQNWNNWYTCPRIYCMYENVPLHYTMLKYDNPLGDFVPLDYEDINKWRTHKDKNLDIMDFNPTYQGRGVIDDNKIIPTSKKSLVLLPYGVKYSYPGFTSDSKHPNGLFTPCCYQTNKNIKAAFGIEQEWDKTYNTYIQGIEKELGFYPRRIGMVPPKILKILGAINPKCITGDMTPEKKCFFRFGIKQGGDSFLNVLSDIYLDTLDSTDLKNYIVKSLDSNKFKTINNGLLEIYFRNYGKQSSLQNFLEYTLSDEVKEYKFYYELLTERSQNLKILSNNHINGLILIIFDIKYNKNRDEPDIEILCPYFSPSIIKSLNNFTKVSFIIKRGNVYEPVYYFDGNPRPKKIFDVKGNSYIENLIDIFKKTSREVIESDIIQVARHIKKPRFDRKYNLMNIITYLLIAEEKNWSNEYIKLKPNENEVYQLLVDIDNKIFGLMLSSGAIIPIYPQILSTQEFATITNGFKYKDTIKFFKMVKIEIRPRVNYKKTTLAVHLEIYSILKVLTEGVVDIVPIKFFANELGNTTGFLTNVGVYISVLGENRKLVTKNTGYVNYQEVDHKLIEYEHLEFKNSFIIPIDLVHLNNTLKTFDESTIEKFRFSHYYKLNNDIILLETNSKVFIPITPLPELDFARFLIQLLPVFSDITLNRTPPSIGNLEEYKKTSSILSKITAYKIPLKIAGSIMNDTTKIIEKIFLETGFEINLTNKFKINKVDNKTFIINNLINHEIENDVDEHLVNKSHSQSNRGNVIDKFNYNTDTYNAIRFMIYRLLQTTQFSNLSIYLQRIINSIDISISSKRKLIYPFFEIIYNLVINPIEKPITGYPTINIELLCDFDKCLGNLCKFTDVGNYNTVDYSNFIWLSYRLINSKLNDTKWLKKLLITKKIIAASDTSSNLQDKFLQNINDNIGELDRKNFTTAITEYNSLVDGLSKNICKLNIIDEGNRIAYIKYRIIEEVLRNSYSKSQLFENFKQLNLDEKFKFNKETEILISHKELKDKILLNNLYTVLKKNYFRKISGFDEMEYKINIELLRGDKISSRDSIEQCIIGNIERYKIKFVSIEKQNRNNSVITNIIKLNNNQFRDIFTEIMNLNTPLTKKLIGEEGFYKFKIINRTKKLKR